MAKGEKLVSALANSFVSLGFSPPVYDKPKWYQFKLKKLLRYYDKHNWPYTLRAD